MATDSGLTPLCPTPPSSPHSDTCTCRYCRHQASLQAFRLNSSLPNMSLRSDVLRGQSPMATDSGLTPLCPTPGTGAGPWQPDEDHASHLARKCASNNCPLAAHSNWLICRYHCCRRCDQSTGAWNGTPVHDPTCEQVIWQSESSTSGSETNFGLGNLRATSPAEDGALCES